MGEFPQSCFSLFLLSSCSFLYLNLNLVALRTSAFFFFILLHMLKPVVFDYPNISSSVNICLLCFIRAKASIFYIASYFF